jgi:spore germination cell wall hydrolase CwlJ-like protein
MFVKNERIDMTSVMCVALAIYFESASSNQPIDDQYSVALVVRNRVHDTGMKPCDVVFAPKQFSSLNHALDMHGHLKPAYRPHGKAWRNSKKIARTVLSGKMPDITNGARFYYANYITPPSWSKGMRFTASHGKHLYWRKRNKNLQYTNIDIKHGNQPAIAANEPHTSWD